MQNAGDLWMIYWDMDEMICKCWGFMDDILGYG